MIEKLKKILLFIVAPVAAIGAFIVYLLSRVSELKSQVGQAKAEQEFLGIIGKKEDAAHEAELAKIKADSALAEYKRIRDAYLQQGGTGPDSEPKP